MSKKPIAWDRLDNAAKIFPSNTTKRDTKVFRFSCELTEDIIPDILQAALEETMEYFPIFRSVMRKGLFWNYLEESRLKPVVTEEHKPICSPLYDPNVRNLLFEVTYFHKRINFDVFHALTDGTGAMQFLKMLVSRYLRLRYPELDLPTLDHDASPTQKSEDSFQKYYDPGSQKHAQKPKRIKAYQLRGGKLSEGRLGVIEGRIPVKPLLEAAHQHHTTLTVLVAAVMIDAIHKQMSVHDNKKPIILAIPVNLRNYFASETARNFFGVVNVGYRFDEGSGELSDIIRSVSRELQEALTKENLGRIISGYIKIEKSAIIRIVPLPLKNLVLKQAGRINLTESTTTVSNIGRTAIPEPLKPYIRMFSVVCSTDRMQACLCSCDDLLTVSFSSAFESTEVQKHFFRTLTEMGIPVEVVSNHCEEEAPKVAKINPFKPQKTGSCTSPEDELRSEKKRYKHHAKQLKKDEKQQKKSQKRAEKAAKKQAKTAQKAEKRQQKQEKKAVRRERKQKPHENL